jgi:hypothetical protein
MAEGDYIWQTPVLCKGVNNTMPPELIDDGELSDAANYEPDLTGQGWLVKRGGLTKTDTTERTAKSYSIYSGKLANYYHNGTVIYNFAGTSVGTGMAAAHDIWTSTGTLDIFVNGTDAQKSANGTSFAALSNVPTGAKTIVWHNNMLFAAGHDTGKIRWSDLGTTETWTATNEWVLPYDNVALVKAPNAVLALHDKAFYLLSGTKTLDVQVLYSSTREGCTAIRSGCVTPYGIFWWSRPGIVWMKGDYSLDYPMLRKLSKTLNGLNRAYDSSVHAVWNSFRGCVHFWLVNGAATTVNLRVDFYPYYDAFYIHTGAGVTMSCSGTAVVSGAENVYVSGYASSTYLYKQSGAQDVSTAIASYFETKNEGNPMVERSTRSTMLTTDLTSAETITVDTYPDNKAASSVSTAITPGTGKVDSYIATNLQNTRLKHKVSDSGTTATRIIQLTHFGSVTKVR